VYRRAPGTCREKCRQSGYRLLLHFIRCSRCVCALLYKFSMENLRRLRIREATLILILFPMENLRSLRVREVTLEFSHINNSRLGPRARELSSHYVIDRTNLWVCWQLAQNTQISLIWKLWAGNWLTAVRIVYSLLLLPSGTKINIGHQPLIYRYDMGIY